MKTTEIWPLAQGVPRQKEKAAAGEVKRQEGGLHIAVPINEDGDDDLKASTAITPTTTSPGLNQSGGLFNRGVNKSDGLFNRRSSKSDELFNRSVKNTSCLTAGLTRPTGW